MPKSKPSQKSKVQPRAELVEDSGDPFGLPPIVGEVAPPPPADRPHGKEQ